MAFELQQAAQSYFTAGSVEHGLVIMDQANVQQNLAGLGPEAEERLRATIPLYQRARSCLRGGSAEYGKTLTNEGNAWLRLAEHGGPTDNVTAAIDLYEQSCLCFPTGSMDYANGLIGKADAHRVLASRGVDAYQNLKLAVAFSQEARSCLVDGTHEYGFALMNEGNAWLYLAEHETAAENLKTAVSLYQQSRRCIAPNTLHYARSLMNEGNARSWLSEWEREGGNLDAAVALYQQAQTCFSKGGMDYGRSLMGEAGARFRLAEMESGTENLNAVVTLCEEARLCFPNRGCNYADALINEARARVSLAYRGEKVTENVTAATALYGEAGDAVASQDIPSLTMHACSARARLLRQASCEEEAYYEMKRSLEAVESMRELIRNEGQRRKFLEEHSSLYREMVDICLALGRDAEGWHWAERGKLRSLLDLLGSARPRWDTDDKKQTFDEWQAAQQDLYDAENLRRHGNNGGPRSFEFGTLWFGFPMMGFGEGSEPNWEEQAARLRAAREKERQCRERFTALLEEGRDLVQVEVPQPVELAARVRELAGVEQHVKKSREGRRSLLVEYFLLGEEQYCVFLLPLWEVEALDHSTPKPLPLRVERVNLPEGTIENTLRGFNNALLTARIGFAGRDRAGTLGGDTVTVAFSQEEQTRARQNALAAFDDLPRLLGDAFIKPWEEVLNELRPTELVVVCNGFLHLLPLHFAEVDGRRLIERYPLVYLPSATLSGDLLKKRAAQQGGEGKGLPALVMGPADRDLIDADAEVLEVAHHLKVSPHQFEAMKTTVLQEHAGKVGWAHLATHSGFDREDYLNSWIRFNGEALRLSRLFSDETLEMRGLDLWYQGSCESAGCEPGQTDELMGFVRGLIYAGARSVMATLWPVDDGAARRFAQRFYFHLQKGKTKAAAYQSAVGDLLNDKEYNNPYFSAPFVLFGDGLVD